MKILKYIFLLGVILSLFWLLTGCQSDDSPEITIGEPSVELNVDVLGRTHNVSLDSEGRLTVSAALASSDGTVILSIDKGTQLLSNDKPLSSIWITTEQELPAPRKKLISSGQFTISGHRTRPSTDH